MIDNFCPTLDLLSIVLLTGTDGCFTPDRFSGVPREGVLCLIYLILRYGRDR